MNCSAYSLYFIFIYIQFWWGWQGGGNGEIEKKINDVVTEKLQDPCKTRFKIYCSFWLSNNDPNVISHLYFPIFPLIYIYSAFLFISSFGGDGRGGDGEIQNKITRPNAFFYSVNRIFLQQNISNSILMYLHIALMVLLW